MLVGSSPPSPTAKIGVNVAIYPFVYVGDAAVIADGVTLEPGVVVGDGRTRGSRLIG